MKTHEEETLDRLETRRRTLRDEISSLGRARSVEEYETVVFALAARVAAKTAEWRIGRLEERIAALELQHVEDVEALSKAKNALKRTVDATQKLAARAAGREREYETALATANDRIRAQAERHAEVAKIIAEAGFAYRKGLDELRDIRHHLRMCGYDGRSGSRAIGRAADAIDRAFQPLQAIERKAK